MALAGSLVHCHARAICGAGAKAVYSSRFASHHPDKLRLDGTADKMGGKEAWTLSGSGSQYSVNPFPEYHAAIEK